MQLSVLALHCDPVWGTSKDGQQVFKNWCYRDVSGWLSEPQGVTPSHMLEKSMVWTTCTRRGTDVITDSFAEPEVEACS